MRKNKIKSALIIICFLFINVLFFNYIVFDNLNLSSLKNLSFLQEYNNTYQYMKYEREFVEDNQLHLSLIQLGLLYIRII